MPLRTGAWTPAVPGAQPTPEADARWIPDPHAPPPGARPDAHAFWPDTPPEESAVGRDRGRGRRRTLIALVLLALAVAAGVTAYQLLRGDGGGADWTGGEQTSGQDGGAEGPTTGGAGGGTPSPTPSGPGSASSSPAVGTVTASATRVPILMYHLVSTPPPSAAYPELYVRPAAFARQMKYLHDEGYAAVTLRRVAQAWRGEATLPTKPVVISFDDGYPSHYQTAAPIMAQYGWSGLLNADWKVLSESSRLLAQVKVLAAAGWEIGSHSLTHPDLTTLDAATLQQEIAGSRRTLEEKLGVSIETFCYPAGRYDATVAAAVRDAGYWTATTTDPGLALKTEPYKLKRIRINGSTTLAQFADALHTGL